MKEKKVANKKERRGGQENGKGGWPRKWKGEGEVHQSLKEQQCILLFLQLTKILENDENSETYVDIEGICKFHKLLSRNHCVARIPFQIKCHSFNRDCSV